MKDKIAGKLLEANLVSQDQLHKALDQQNKDGGSVGQNLVRTGALSEMAYTEFLGKMYSLPTVALSETEISTEVASLIPMDVAVRFGVVPIERRGRVLKVAMANPSNIFAIDDIKFITGMEIQPVVAAESEIKQAIDKYYDSADSLREVLEGLEDDVELVEDEEEQADVGSLSAESENAPVVKLVNSVLVDAVKRGASDIHVECYEKHMRVRYRIDGVLQEMMQPPTKNEERDPLAPQDHVRAGHRRATDSPGWTDQTQGRRQESRPPCVDPALHLRREDRDAYPRQGEPQARSG